MCIDKIQNCGQQTAKFWFILDFRIVPSKRKIMKIETGENVIVILHSPREKLFGPLEEIGSAGVFMRGIELSYFEDWSRAIAQGEPHLPMSDYFLPMWRVERVSRDEATSDSLSLSEQFEQRTGRNLSEF
jgi:hypothetical protein